MKRSEKIIELRAKLEELNPTFEEVEKFGNEKYNYTIEDFITDNTWKDKSNFHIHIGFVRNLYLNPEEAEDFINWLRNERKQ